MTTNTKKNNAGYTFLKLITAVWLALMFFYTPVFSASTIKGNVKEKGTGTPIEKVKITLIPQKNTTIFYHLYTDNKGGFFKSGLEYGVYQITIEKEGYVPAQSTFRLGVDEKMDFQSEMEVMAKAASPTASPDLIDTARSLLDSGKYDEAIAKFNEAIAKNAGIFILYYNRGLAYEKKGDKTNAINDYLKATELKPDFMISLAALGKLYSKEGKFEKAVGFYKRAFDLGITDTVALYNYGACLINLGKNDDAKPVFEKIITLDQAYPDAYYQLGIIYYGLNDIPKTKELFQKFLQLDPKNENAPVAQEILNTMK